MKFDEIYNTIMEGMELREREPFTRYSTGKSYGGRQRGRKIYGTAPSLKDIGKSAAGAAISMAIPRGPNPFKDPKGYAAATFDAADKATSPSTYTKGLARLAQEYPGQVTLDPDLHKYADNVALVGSVGALGLGALKALNKARKFTQKNPKAAAKIAAKVGLGGGMATSAGKSATLDESKSKVLRDLWHRIRHGVPSDRNFFTNKGMNSKFDQIERDDGIFRKIPHSKTTPGHSGGRVGYRRLPTPTKTSKATFKGPDPEAWRVNKGGHTLKESLKAIGALKRFFRTRKASSGKIVPIKPASPTTDATKKPPEPPVEIQFTKRAKLQQRRK